MAWRRHLFQETAQPRMVRGGPSWGAIMPRTRAWRRHERRVKLNRRYRIIATAFLGTTRDPRARHVHLRCNCFDDPREQGRGRRSIETREWRALERRAWG